LETGADKRSEKGKRGEKGKKKNEGMSKKNERKQIENLLLFFLSFFPSFPFSRSSSLK